MMAGCGFLSEAGDSLWETLISSAFKSTPTIFETRRIRSSVFSFLLKAFATAILFKVVDFLVSLARHSLKFADMQFEVLVFSLQNLDFFIFGM